MLGFSIDFSWMSLRMKPVCLFPIFSMSETLPTGQLSNVPWRRSGVKYTNNEAYFDVIEEVDAIIDKSGTVVSGEIHGYVRAADLFVPTHYLHNILHLLPSVISMRKLIFFPPHRLTALLN